MDILGDEFLLFYDFPMQVIGEPKHNEAFQSNDEIFKFGVCQKTVRARGTISKA
jgi:hypothetical protein